MRIGAMEIAPGQGHEAGRQLLARLYREYTGRAMPEILVSERGKPYFADGSLHFSISHTKKHVFCAVGEKPLGIDGEEIGRNINLHLADKILSPAERVRWEASEDRTDALLRLWVLKEAAAKLSGEGLRGYPNQTDFRPDDPRIHIIENCYVAIMEA